MMNEVSCKINLPNNSELANLITSLFPSLTCTNALITLFLALSPSSLFVELTDRNETRRSAIENPNSRYGQVQVGSNNICGVVVAVVAVGCNGTEHCEQRRAQTECGTARGKTSRPQHAKVAGKWLSCSDAGECYRYISECEYRLSDSEL